MSTDENALIKNIINPKRRSTITSIPSSDSDTDEDDTDVKLRIRLETKQRELESYGNNYKVFLNGTTVTTGTNLGNSTP